MLKVSKILTAKSNLKVMLNILNEEGWIPSRQTGSHMTFKKESHPHIITVPMHTNKDLGPGLERSIAKEIVCADPSALGELKKQGLL